MRRLLLPALALAALLAAACEATLEDRCIGGACGPDTLPPPTTSSTTSSSGSGGAGGGGGGAGGGDTCASVAQTGDFPCEVYAALKAKCLTCHTDPPQSGAPFPLLTLEHTRAPYYNTPQQIWEAMGPAIQSGFMPLDPAPDLTPDEKQTLLDWLAGCAPPAPDGTGCECADPAACP